MKIKICNKENCKYCKPYNESWCICWNPKIKGSRVQMNIECTVNKIEKGQIWNN